MTPEKQNNLEAAGWVVTDAAGFVGMTNEERALLETKHVLTRELKRRRLEAKLSQAKLAKRIESSQSRIAHIEAGTEGATLDLLYRAVLAVGMTPKELGAIVAREAEAAGVASGK